MTDLINNTVRAQREKGRQREIEAWGLRVQGHTQRSIAERLGVSRRVVRVVLDRAEKRLLARLERRIKNVKARQSAQIEHLLSEAMSGWERSRQKGRKRRVKTVTVEVSGPNGQIVEMPGKETVWETTWRDGDPRFLQTALALLAAERELWGIGRREQEQEEPGLTLRDIILADAAERQAQRSPEDRAARLAFKAGQLKKELAQIEHQQATGEDDAEDAEVTAWHGEGP